MFNFMVPFRMRAMISMKNIMQSDSYMSKLYSQLIYSPGELKTLQLIVLVVFGAID